jgi:hypothetical protein
MATCLRLTRPHSSRGRPTCRGAVSYFRIGQQSYSVTGAQSRAQRDVLRAWLAVTRRPGWDKRRAAFVAAAMWPDYSLSAVPVLMSDLRYVTPRLVRRLIWLAAVEQARSGRRRAAARAYVRHPLALPPRALVDGLPRRMGKIACVPGSRRERSSNTRAPHFPCMSLARPRGRLARGGREISDGLAASHQREDGALRVCALGDPSAARHFNRTVEDLAVASLHALRQRL